MLTHKSFHYANAHQWRIWGLLRPSDRRYRNLAGYCPSPRIRGHPDPLERKPTPPCLLICYHNHVLMISYELVNTRVRHGALIMEQIWNGSGENSQMDTLIKTVQCWAKIWHNGRSNQWLFITSIAMRRERCKPSDTDSVHSGMRSEIGSGQCFETYCPEWLKP